MSEEMKSIANWAKELGVPEKKLKDAVKSAAITPDAKRGICGLYSRESIEKARKVLG